MILVLMSLIVRKEWAVWLHDCAQLRALEYAFLIISKFGLHLLTCLNIE